MAEFHTEEEINSEIESVSFQNKIPAFNGRQYPIEYLNSREFEILIYFIYKREIGLGINADKYNMIHLMKGTSERGRDCILLLDKNNVGIIQCKRYSNLISKPDFAREIIKFVLHSIQDKSLISDINNFHYYFIALKGFSEPTLELLKNFNQLIIKEPKLEEWVSDVLDENKSLKFKTYDEVKDRLLEILCKIKVESVTGLEIDQKLKNADEIIPMFFEVKMVASEDMLRKVLSEQLGSLNDEDIEKLLQKLKVIPKENRMFFGWFSIYGYDNNFYKILIRDKDLLYQIINVKLEINKKFINYLKDMIEKYHVLYVSGLPDISPFTKQVVVPYLFGKYSRKFQEENIGQFLLQISKEMFNNNFYKLQTFDDIKKYLLEIGEKVLEGDFSSFVGNGELLALKKKVANWIHRDFKTVQEMSERFDKDMVKLKPIIIRIEQILDKILPLNPTIIIEDKGIGDTVHDFVEVIKNVQKFESN